MNIELSNIFNQNGGKEEWTSFQTWLYKWNTVMKVVTSILIILLLLAILIVNILDGRITNYRLNDENDTQLFTKSSREINENPRNKDSKIQEVTYFAQTFTTSSIPSGFGTKSTPTITTDIETHDTSSSGNLEVEQCLSMDLTELPFQLIEFRPKKHEFQIDILASGHVQVELETVPLDGILIWFDLNSTLNLSENLAKGVHCLCIYNESIILTDLKNDTAYTACVISHQELGVSPHDCISFFTKIEKFLEPIWLTEDVKLLTIGLACFGLLLCIFIGLAIGFVIIRSFPMLMKGAKRIVVVKSNEQRNSNVLVMPKEWITDDEYNEKRVPYRKMSMISTYSGRRYEQAEPSRYDIVKWELDQAMRRSDAENNENYLKVPKLPPRDSIKPVYSISKKIPHGNDYYIK